MNKDNAKDYLPLVQALAEGKTIQSSLDGVEQWQDMTNLSFSMRPNCYRIKPEPKNIWINEYTWGYGQPHISEDQATRGASCNAVRTAVHYREVIEE